MFHNFQQRPQPGGRSAVWLLIRWVPALSLALMLSACDTQQKHYVIGISQCSADIWREKQNSELRMAAYLREDVELRFAAAYDSDERQIQQIDSLVSTGIDLLIVAPNQVATISPAIDRAFDRGIPVIVFERKTSSKKYTAYMGADNYEMGRIMGEYVMTRLHGQVRVIEVMGLQGSSPAIERHNGFTDAIGTCPGIRVTATVQGDWTEESAYAAVKALLDTLPPAQAPDYVFAQNDRMAMGARKAFAESPYRHRKTAVRQAPTGKDAEEATPTPATTLFCGIDGLPGDGGGIRLVRDSVLDATYIYPTRGDLLLLLAVNILEGKPYDKENLLMSALVTQDNAHVLLMQDEEIIRQSGYLDNLQDMASEYMHKLNTQRAITLLAIGAVVLLLLVIALLYLYHQGKISMRRQRVVSNLWNLDASIHDGEKEERQKAHTEGHDSEHTQQARSTTQTSEGATYGHRQPAHAPSGSATPASSPSGSTSQFITRFREVVEARLTDSELSVEDLAAAMHLSRVQLYRKVKTITNSSPVELLRRARLNRGYQLLLTTDKTVSEIAYDVGFTAPSYFTKCFKDEFGMLPGEARNEA